MGVRAFLLLRVVVVLSLAGLSLVLWSSAASAAVECSNEARREEQTSGYLPDCRAYEMVSPLEKKDADVSPSGKLTMSSLDGEHVTYAARAGFGDTAGSGNFGFTQYLASREKNGHWVSHGITPPAAQDAYQFTVGATTVATYSEDLTRAVVEGYELPGATGGIPKGVNYYEEATATRALETITQDPIDENVFFFFSWGTLRGFSGDLSTVTFESPAALLPETSGFETRLYVWDHNVLSVPKLPDGTPPPGGSIAPAQQGLFAIQSNLHTVSRDGAAAPFLVPGNGQLYLWRRGQKSAWVSESEASVPIAEPKGVRYQKMTPDGKHVVFTSADPLTDADPGGAGVGLYIYADGPNPKAESNLTFIGRVEDTVTGFGVPAVVAGTSEDAKRVYFYNEGNVYLWDEGTVQMVIHTGHPLEPFGEFGGESSAGQVSADGHVLAFTSNASLLGVQTQERIEMYVYDENGESVRCVSCPSGGAPVTSNVEIDPNLATNTNTISMVIDSRVVTHNGRYVLFATAEPLVARDVNAVSDVYQYDTSTGTVSLLSPGTQPEGAWLASIDENGNNVFILTRSRLVRGDTDTLADLYDVRVGGGIPQAAPDTGSCVGDECQGTPSAAPSFNTASGFSGLGNVPPASGKASGKALTRSRKLARALWACRAKPKKARRRCVAQARRKYGLHGAKRSVK